MKPLTEHEFTQWGSVTPTPPRSALTSFASASHEQGAIEAMLLMGRKMRPARAECGSLRDICPSGRGFGFWSVVLGAVFGLLVLGVGGAWAEPGRIVSLAPSLTEILFASGAGGRVVGVSDYCDYPAEVKALPRVGGISNPSLEAIVGLRPDVVVMTVDGNPQGMDERLERMGIGVYVVRARRLAELPDAIRGIGMAVNAPGAEALAGEMEKKMRKVAESASVLGDGGRALFIIWPEPLMVAGPGTLINEALGMLGYLNLSADAASNYPKYSIEEAMLRKPDVIFIGAGMGDYAETTNLKDLSARLVARLGSTPAVAAKRVYYLSDRLFRLSPRAIDGVYEIIEADMKARSGGIKEKGR